MNVEIFVDDQASGARRREKKLRFGVTPGSCPETGFLSHTKRTADGRSGKEADKRGTSD
jgi:hypothetical protein